MADNTFSARPTTLFENVALAFSGGGFRASSFALGTLSLFHSVTAKPAEDGQIEEPLLHKVRFLGSASGGTIATSLYALYNANGRSFGSFYGKLFKETQGDTLLTRALEILSTNSMWNGKYKRNQNLINSFARAYDELLFTDEENGFSSATLGHLKSENPKSHLWESCFNATEFYHGLLFRQNVNMRAKPGDKDVAPLYGNFAMNLEHSIAEKIKLSDILAASSCFPGGFEPIIFPDDFAHEKCQASDLLDGLKINLENCETAKPPIGLMDGGIADNLGVDSMIQANTRSGAYLQFDYMVTNDVGSHFISPYEPSSPSNCLLGKPSLFAYSIMFLLVFIIGLDIFLCKGSDKGWAVAGTFLMFISVMLPSLLVYFYLRVKGIINKKSSLNLKSKFGGRIDDILFKKLFHTPVNALIWMTKSRISSTSILVGDLFLKRIRQLLDDKFYEDTRWTGRAKGNRVYDLSFTNDNYRKSKNHASIEPSQRMQKVAEIAYRMTTTLWFDQQRDAERHAQACLIACGQFTTCYNLLDSIAYIKGCNGYATLPKKYQDRADDIECQLKDMYEAFKEDPFHLYNKLGELYIKGFQSTYAKDIPEIEAFLASGQGLTPM